MDPYLERYWLDVHCTLVVHARAAMQRQLGEGLRARIEERVTVESPADAEPLVVRHASEKARQRFIEIIDPASGGRLVTVIEFLSPSNKLAGDGQDKYRQKQREVISAGLNLVEIDLTRSGTRDLGYPVAALPSSHRATYLACVYRGFGADQFELYPIPLRVRLPAIRIPLRDSDPDVALDLQPLIEQAYAEGRFDDIDYTRPLEPPLEGDEATWADELLRGAVSR